MPAALKNRSKVPSFEPISTTSSPGFNPSRAMIELDWSRR